MAKASSFRPFVLGRYNVLLPLGAGGMGRVYLAEPRDRKGSGRPVVIKVMLDHHRADDRFEKMFLDEAAIALNLRHPNVAQVLEMQEADHRLFLVSEYVDGPDLRHLLHMLEEGAGQLPTEMALYVVWCALRALAYVHQATAPDGTALNIIHRDFSPENLLISASTGDVKLTDFGVAKAVGRLSQTLAGQVKGKLGYMAPEQVYGTADQRADLFSGGVVLWEALAGRRLFTGRNELAVMEQVLNKAIEPPSTLRKDVNRKVDAVVARALSRDPARRFQTAQEFSAAVAALLEGRDMTPVALGLARLTRLHAPPLTEAALKALPRPPPGASGEQDLWNVRTEASELARVPSGVRQAARAVQSRGAPAPGTPETTPRPLPVVPHEDPDRTAEETLPPVPAVPRAVPGGPLPQFNDATEEWEVPTRQVDVPSPLKPRRKRSSTVMAVLEPEGAPKAPASAAPAPPRAPTRPKPTPPPLPPQSSFALPTLSGPRESVDLVDIVEDIPAHALPEAVSPLQALLEDVPEVTWPKGQQVSAPPANKAPPPAPPAAPAPLPSATAASAQPPPAPPAAAAPALPTEHKTPPPFAAAPLALEVPPVTVPADQAPPPPPPLRPRTGTRPPPPPPVSMAALPLLPTPAPVPLVTPEAVPSTPARVGSGVSPAPVPLEPEPPAVPEPAPLPDATTLRFVVSGPAKLPVHGTINAHELWMLLREPGLPAHLTVTAGDNPARELMQLGQLLLLDHAVMMPPALALPLLELGRAPPKGAPKADHTPIAKLLAGMRERAETGVILVTVGPPGQRAAIWLQEGQVVYVQWPQQRPTLLDDLVKDLAPARRQGVLGAVLWAAAAEGKALWANPGGVLPVELAPRLAQMTVTRLQTLGALTPPPAVHVVVGAHCPFHLPPSASAPAGAAAAASTPA